MRYSRITLALALMGTIAATAHGQGIGGLIKNKVGDAVKPKEEQAAKDAPSESSPFKYELTAETMAAFKRGLELEIKMRADYKTRAAKHVAATAAYKKCEQGIPLRPEASKIADEASSRMDKAKTPEETQSATQWMQKEMMGLSTKVCGAEPGPPPDQAQSFTKAQEAGAIEFGKNATRKPPRDAPHEDPILPRPECLESDSVENLVPCGSDSPSRYVLSQQQEIDAELIELYLHEYGLFKELITKFCSLDKQTRADAAKHGVRVQGSNDQIYWIFTKDFAAMVNPHCETLMNVLVEVM